MLHRYKQHALKHVLETSLVPCINYTLFYLIDSSLVLRFSLTFTYFNLISVETNEISKTLGIVQRRMLRNDCRKEKNISRWIRTVNREERNDPKEIAPRRSNLSACKKRCNAVTAPVIAAPLRVVDHDSKR